MANPFLMDDDLPMSNDLPSNPFLMEAGGEDEEEYGDNPFLTGASNPFSFGDVGDAGEDLDLPITTAAAIFGTATEAVTTNADFYSETDVNGSTHFFDTTIMEDEPPHPKPVDLHIKHPHTVAAFDDSGAYSSEDELKFKRKPPGPPPRPGAPPSKATQDLIMSVANELDQTSIHLLDRLPKTRTPSPVSMRDLHSPSPTPEHMNFGDLLDVSEGGQDPTTQQNIFGTDQDLIGNDNPFASVDPQPSMQIDDKNIKHPSRPPPPRPVIPPRVSPTTHFPPAIPPQPNVHPHRPPPPAVPAQPQQQHQEADLFDMFGTGAPTRPPKPPAPKTKEDILSLYSTPAPPSNNSNESNNMTDLLSGDILDGAIPLDNAPRENDLMASYSTTKTTTTAVITSNQQPISSVVAPPPVPSPVQVPAPTPAQAPVPVPAQVPAAAPVPVPVPAPAPIPASIVETYVQPEPEVAVKTTPPTRPSPPARPSPPIVLENKAIVEEIIEPVEPEIVDFPAEVPETVSPNTAQFNMVITCEPDNPPSDEEVYDYQPTPSCQTPKIPEVHAIHELAEAEAAANPFQSPPEAEDGEVCVEPMVEPIPIYQPPPTPAQGVEYVESYNDAAMDIFGVSSVEPTPIVHSVNDDAFDAFAAKFDSADNQVKQTNVFLDEVVEVSNGFGSAPTTDAWGDSVTPSTGGFNDAGDGFGNDEGFDSFLAMTAPAPKPKFARNDSKDSDEGGTKEFNVVIRPKDDMGAGAITPIMPPPSKTSTNNSVYSGDSSPRVNPFDKGFEEVSSVEGLPLEKHQQPLERTDSQESPATPLFDDDVSQPLEDFPRLNYTGDGWEMQLRQPNKKRITAQRFWKKILLKMAHQGDNPVLQLFNGPTDKEPFQELPLQACYSVSEVSAQQYDQFGKIFTVKLQYIFYKERPGVRPGQVTKAERITSKLSQFAAYAIQGDYQGVKEFGSDLKKLGIPVEHAPQVSELFKLGSLSFEDMKQFSVCIEESLFKLDVHRDRALNYKTEEVQITAVDELYVDQDAEGHILRQIARVRLFFLGFLSGMPSVELGVNDLWRQGKEVVGRHDIIPVVTEEWIRLEGVEFHTCVQQDEYERTRTIKFQPPDACYIELMRFRVRPPKNRELPLQLKATWVVTGNKVELRADILVPGFASRKLGQIPCEDVMIRFPIPECWIYLFRVEKHFRYGSVKSAHRRTGKVKGIERILGAVEQLQESLIETTSGSAKYEHQHRALVWRCPRLPKEGQGAYTTHQLVCRLALTSYDQIPEQLAPFCFVEFTMPATQVSHTTVRSVSIQESDSDDPPEKYVRYLARHEYKVGIEHTTNTETNPYLAATQVKATIREEPEKPKPAASPVAPPSDSDSDSN